MVDGQGVLHDGLSLLWSAGQACGLCQPPFSLVPPHEDEQVAGVLDALSIGL